MRENNIDEMLKKSKMRRDIMSEILQMLPSDKPIIKTLKAFDSLTHKIQTMMLISGNVDESKEIRMGNFLGELSKLAEEFMKQENIGG